MARKAKKQDWSPRRPVPGDRPISDPFLKQYLETALWASLDDDGDPLENNYTLDDFSDEAIAQAIRETNDFITENRVDLEAVGSMSQHGHDFFLTRNGHGAGFWDRGYGEVGRHLTIASKAYGEANVYAGDDDLLYFG